MGTDGREQYDVTAKLIRSIAEASNPYAGYFIASGNILSVVVTESILSLTPTVEIKFIDVGDVLENRPILDGDYIYVEMGSMTNSIDVSSVFKISSIYFEASQVSGGLNVVHLVGYMAPDDAFIGVKQQSFKGSSDSVISDVCGEISVTTDIKVSGVESNVWYQNGNAYQFIRHVADRSYIAKDGVFVYVGIDGKLVYTSYKTEIAGGGTFIGIQSKKDVESPTRSPKEVNILYFHEYNVLNNSALYNTAYNYGTEYRYYDLDKVEKKTYTTSTGSDRNSDKSNVAVTNVDKVTNFEFMEAVHDDTYMESMYQGKLLNSLYKNALFSTTILLNVDATADIKLFDGVNIDFPSTTYPGNINDVYSGEYNVGVITYSVSRGSMYTKEVLICRNGINMSKTNKGKLISKEVI